MNKLEEYVKAKLLLTKYKEVTNCNFRIALKYNSSYPHGELLEIEAWVKNYIDFDSYEELEKYFREKKGFTFNTDHIINREAIKKVWETTGVAIAYTPGAVATGYNGTITNGEKLDPMSGAGTLGATCKIVEHE